jgi:transposase
VLFEDECHLKHGDSTGYVWGKKGQRVEVPMMNERHSRTFYGALNLLDRQFHLKQFGWANMENTVAFLRWLSEEVYPYAKRIFIIWDGASFHTGQVVKDFLDSVNRGLEKSEWKIYCLLFAPNAPDQNPTEDCWLKAKSHIRKNILQNQTFAQTVQCFKNAFNELDFDFYKLQWYF